MLIFNAFFRGAQDLRPIILIYSAPALVEEPRSGRTLDQFDKAEQIAFAAAQTLNAHFLAIVEIPSC